jgi:hypothetical protein
VTASRDAGHYSHKEIIEMAKHEGAEHHKKAAEHHKKAAERHEQAAKHHEEGDHKTADATLTSRPDTGFTPPSVPKKPLSSTSPNIVNKLA